MVKQQNRDDRNGRYAFDGDMSRLCVCGHTLGDHFYGAPHECATYSKTGNTNAPDHAPCDCQKFRPKRVKK